MIKKSLRLAEYLTPKTSVRLMACGSLISISIASVLSAQNAADPLERARQAVADNNARIEEGSDVQGVTYQRGSADVISESSSSEIPTTPTISSPSSSSSSGDDETISLNVDDQEVRVILRNIAELFELNVVIPESLTGRTSLNLRDVTWQQVFDIVLEEQGYSWYQANGIIRIRKGAIEEDTSEEDTRVIVLDDGTLKVEFRSTEISTILSLIAQKLDINVVIPPDESLLSELDLRLSRVTWQQVFTVTLGQFGFGYIDQDGIIIIQTLEQINGVPDVSRVFHVKYSEAESIAALIEKQSGVKGVVTDSRSNVVIVTGNPSRFPEIKALIETLDRPTPQVMIESRFVEVSNKDNVQVGIDWASLFADEGVSFNGSYGAQRDTTDVLDRSASNDTTSNFSSSNSRSSGDSSATSTSLIQSTVNQVQGLLDSTVVNSAESAIFSVPAFNMVLRALKKLNDSKIISNPTVLALNGQQAEIKIVDHFYVQEPGTISDSGRSTQGDIKRLDPLPGIELKVTPTISGGDFISLKVVPQVNDIVGTQTFSGTEIPTVRQRTTTTHVMVKDRETLAIGGLIDENESTEIKKIPLLGSVPGLGQLFRYDKKSKENTNQIIFITASILNPNETNYIDVMGIDRLNDLGLTERDVVGSGFQISPEERAMQEAILQYRRDEEAREREEKLTLQIEAYRRLEEKRALEALKELEETSSMEFTSESEDSESASAMDRLKSSGNRRIIPVF